MIVVCYRPDPTQNVDEKLNFVEACSSKWHRSFPLTVEPFRQAPGLSHPLVLKHASARDFVYHAISSYHQHAFRGVSEAIFLSTTTYLSMPQALAEKCLARWNNFSTVIIM